ncbi:MAG: amidohydrolase family protein, partial [Solirubrobacteraceae bacterium]
VWTGERVLEGGDVLCAGGRVVAVGADLSGEPGAAGASVLDATGCVVIPGLVNAHHHLLQSAFRTLPGTRHVPMREWLPAMASAYAAAGIDAELCHATASVGLAEALLCGVTTVADHHLNWPADPAEHLPIAEAVAAAAGELGARVVLVRGSAGDDPDVVAQAATDVASRFGSAAGASAPVAGDSAGAGAGVGVVGVAVGPAGVHSDRPETFAALREVAARFGLVRRTQANEQVDTEIALARYGRRPLELLDEWGWLEPGVTIAHLCDVTADEVALLAERGVTATHAPGCDLPMGWGLAPVGALLDAGVVVGLGTSGGGSNDAGHLLADARLAMQVAPLLGRPLTAIDALTLATRGSAVGLARPELGHLEPGAAADLALFDLGGVADAGVADPVAGLLWAAPGRRPRDVVVAGRLVVESGELVRRSEGAVVAGLHGVLAARRVTA